jgi:hypothetical protein
MERRAGRPGSRLQCVRRMGGADARGSWHNRRNFLGSKDEAGASDLDPMVETCVTG